MIYNLQFLWKYVKLKITVPVLIDPSAVTCRMGASFFPGRVVYVGGKIMFPVQHIILTCLQSPICSLPGAILFCYRPKHPEA